MNRIYNNRLIAILPLYKENLGDSTEIIMKDESIIIHKNITTVIKSLSKYYMIDLKEIKNMYSQLLTSKNLIPIPFDNKNIFIPFKYRKPLCKNDKAFGYINLDFIDTVKPDNKHSIIYLTNGNSLKCLSTVNTIKKHITNGNIIKKCPNNRFMNCNENFFEYNSYSSKKIDPLLIYILRSTLHNLYSR